MGKRGDWRPRAAWATEADVNGWQSAALLLRVWPEGDELRCRLLRVTDASAPVTVGVAQGVDAICDAVRRWLLAR